jgi:hypothetical protein
MRQVAVIFVCLFMGCASASQQRVRGVPAPSVEVFFERPAFAYRIGPEVTTSAVDPARVRADLGAEGARIGCDAIVDITISRNSVNGRAGAWGFCAYRVPTGGTRL